MKDSGIMRRVDSLGRFVLPKELRRQLQIDCNDYLQIYTEGTKIIIQKAQSSCALCNKTEDLIDCLLHKATFFGFFKIFLKKPLTNAKRCAIINNVVRQMCL